MLVWLAALACSAGCDAGNKPAATRAPPSPAVVVWPDVDVLEGERGCRQSAECTLITEDCCGCTAYGSQTGVRKDMLATVVARRTPVCSALTCPSGMSDHETCAARIAVCVQGKCVPETAVAATRRMRPKETPPIGDEAPVAPAPIVPITTIRK